MTAESLRDALVAEWDAHDEAGLVDDIDAIIDAATAEGALIGANAARAGSAAEVERVKSALLRIEENIETMLATTYHRRQAERIRDIVRAALATPAPEGAFTCGHVPINQLTHCDMMREQSTGRAPEEGGTMKVAVKVIVDVDVKAWNDEYGSNESAADIRLAIEGAIITSAESVFAHVMSGTNPSVKAVTLA